MDKNAIVPTCEKVVDFYGDPIPVAQTPEGELFVPLKPLTDFLGLSADPQRRRVLRDPVMKAKTRMVMITAADGKRYQMFALPLDLLPGWLFGVDTGRVKPDLVDKLNRYRAECFKVLWSAFRTQIEPRPSPSDNTTITVLQQIAETARAVAQMAEQQIELERKQQALNSRMDAAARIVKGMQGEIVDIHVRLEVLEDKLQPPALITEEQATEVSNNVKALAELLTSKDAGKNHYQSIFAELYRRFGVSSYKNIRQGQYQAVLKFLEDWHKVTMSAVSTQQSD